MNKRNKNFSLSISLVVVGTLVCIVVAAFMFVRILNQTKTNNIPPVVEVENKTQYDFSDSLKTNGPLTEHNLPSKGDVDVLVVPISFNPIYDLMNNPNLISDINKTFNGTEEDTGYYSVKDFYHKSSYGQLNLNFDVIDSYYKPKFEPQFYERAVTEFGATLLYKEVLKYYDEKIDYTKYDNDNDGYIDSIWMIYTHPVNPKSDLWWAFVANDDPITTNDNVKGYVYGFGGSDFIDPNFFTENKEYDTTNIKLDAHTYIHETGHMMGLDDYYDYDIYSGVNNGGTYGLDYMDYNYGDHGPINKLLLDWVNPIIINDVCDLTVKPYATSGEVYLITKDFKGTIYDSYYLLINYSNEGLYAKDPYFKESGIIVYEVNAQKNYNGKDVVSNGGTYNTGFKYDNSDESKLFVNMLKDKDIAIVDETKDALLLTKNERLHLNNVKINLIVNEVLNNGNIEISFK